MKRIGIGACILLLLLAAAILFSVQMHTVHSNISRQLQQAAQQAESGNWKQAGSHARQAQILWENTRNMTAAMADHAPMEQIEGLFAQLETYTSQQEISDFAATCHYLAKLTDAMGDHHALRWWNLL